MERRLGYLNHNELKKLVPGEIDTAIVPIGTIEAHGITPLGTDVIIPEAMAERIGPEVNAIIAPAVPYGITRGLVGHPGTISIRPDVFRAYVGDLLRSLADIGFAKIVVLNGGDEELRLQNFSVGKVLLMPQWKKHQIHVVDSETAMFFFHTEHYYAAALAEIEKELKALDEMLRRPEISVLLEGSLPSDSSAEGGK